MANHTLIMAFRCLALNMVKLCLIPKEEPNVDLNKSCNLKTFQMPSKESLKKNLGKQIKPCHLDPSDTSKAGLLRAMPCGTFNLTGHELGERNANLWDVRRCKTKRSRKKNKSKSQMLEKENSTTTCFLIF